MEISRDERRSAAATASDLEDVLTAEIPPTGYAEVELNRKAIRFIVRVELQSDYIGIERHVPIVQKRRVFVFERNPDAPVPHPDHRGLKSWLEPRCNSR